MATTSRSPSRQPAQSTNWNPPPTPSVAMGTDLWGKLPKPLVERILAWLPVPDFMRFRSVCRRWNSLPVLQSFLNICAKIPLKGSPWFILFNNTDGLAYDAALRKWFHIPLPTAEGVLQFPVASHGGLVLYYTSRYNTLAVGNPTMPKSWYELPPMPNTQSFESAGLIVTDPETHSYRVVVMGTRDGAHNTLENTTEVYDSQSGTWTFCGTVPAECLPSNPNVVCCGSLYSWCDPDGIVRFNMKKKLWRHIDVLMPTDLEKETLVSHQLVQCDGRIFMVGACEEEFQRRGIRIWLLQARRRLRWAKYDEMPPDLFRQFIGNGAYDVLCIGCDDACFLTTEGGGLMLTYHFKRRRWDAVPEFRTPHTVLSQGFIDGISFWPRIDAQASRESHVIRD